MPKIGQVYTTQYAKQPRRCPYGVEPYWSNGAGSYFFQGDCVDVMEELPGGCVDLAFADPPFNIDLAYDEYKDLLPEQQYYEWTRTWLAALKPRLTPTGSLYVAIANRHQARLRIIAEDLGYHWRDTLVWHYTFGPRQVSKFTPSWVAIHYFTNHHKQWTWNDESVRVPSARQLKYNDRRAVTAGKLPDNVWILLPSESEHCFTPGANALLHSRVCGTFKERTAHPCQMPEPVLERIIKASSNEGDVVFDPFLGSGTTPAVALKHRRKALGVELSKAYLDEHIIPRCEGLS